MIKEVVMSGNFQAVVKEIAILVGEGQRVTVCTATEKITFSRADVYEQDANMIEGRTVNDRGVLIHGSAIQVVYIDEADDE